LSSEAAEFGVPVGAGHTSPARASIMTLKLASKSAAR
jgi:hypothetical protein